MKTKLLALALLAGGTMFAGPRIGIGIGVGVGPGYYGGYYRPAPVYAAPYVAPAPYAYAAPAYVAPAPVYGGGFWVNVGGRRVWREGYRGPAFRGGYRGFRR
jgi:hypothetical protein